MTDKEYVGGKAVDALEIGYWAFQNRKPLDQVTTPAELFNALLAQLYCLKKGFPPPYPSEKLLLTNTSLKTVS